MESLIIEASAMKSDDSPDETLAMVIEASAMKSDDSPDETLAMVIEASAMKSDDSQDENNIISLTSSPIKYHTMAPLILPKIEPDLDVPTPTMPTSELSNIDKVEEMPDLLHDACEIAAISVQDGTPGTQGVDVSDEGVDQKVFHMPQPEELFAMAAPAEMYNLRDEKKYYLNTGTNIQDVKEETGLFQGKEMMYNDDDDDSQLHIVTNPGDGEGSGTADTNQLTDEMNEKRALRKIRNKTRLKHDRRNVVSWNLTCEWADCDETLYDLDKFIFHVGKHIEENLETYAESTDNLICHWQSCGYETTRGINDLFRHIYFHSFHVKLKYLGIQMMIMNNSVHACRTDGSSRNLIPELPESFVCGWVNCGFMSENAEYFYRHVDNHVDACPMNEKFGCNWEGCTVKVRNRTRLRDHLRSHTQEKIVACPTCGGLFSNRCKFTDHLQRQGPLDNLCFQCSHCSKKYTTERLLRDHMRVHVNHYKCPYCDMTCPNPSSLSSHIKYRHSDEKPFECHLCDHKTKAATDLRKHMETHNEKKVFPCEYPGCNYSHKTFNGTMYHYRTVHQNPRKYLCHLCDDLFERGSLLTKHLQKVHKFKWPSGHSRFKYRLHEDGIMRLQMVRYESVELATHFLEKNNHTSEDSNQKDGTVSGTETETESTTPGGEQDNHVEEPVASIAESSQNSFEHLNQEEELNPTYNLEMLTEVALHEPEYAKSVENTPTKSNHVTDLPSPIHGSAFRARVSLQADDCDNFVTVLSSITPEKSRGETTPESSLPEKSLEVESDSNIGNDKHSEEKQSTRRKVRFDHSPRKRKRTS